MPAKDLSALIRSAKVESIQLDSLAFERGEAKNFQGLHIAETTRTIEPRTAEPDVLDVTLRLHLTGTAVVAEQSDIQASPAPVAFELEVAVTGRYRCDIAGTELSLLTDFANTSALAHLNAYLRQYVQETLARAGYPAVVMPLSPVAVPTSSRTGLAINTSD